MNLPLKEQKYRGYAKLKFCETCNDWLDRKSPYYASIFLLNYISIKMKKTILKSKSKLEKKLIKGNPQ